MRDVNDKLVSEEAQKIIKVLDNLFSVNTVDMKLPQGNLKKPIHIIYNIEIKNYMKLIK